MTIPFDTASLNPEQLEAVNWPGGPMLIFAGAGSGKTRVITCRIARLVAEGVWGSRILAVTFTNKAAKEMRDRVEGMVGPEARAMWIGTFHSICARILRMSGSAMGLDPNFTIYDDSDQISLVKEILKKKDLDEKSIQARPVLHMISQAKEKLMSPAAYADEATGFMQQIVAGVYKDYDRRLRELGALDFDDILLQTVKLFQSCPEVLQKYQDRFLHVLVDEYQDVNLVQYKFADLISGKHRNIVIVGDDDQSIYAWRGADVSLMLRFSSDHPDAKVITLAQNYRSTPNILEAAYEVIKHNRTRAEKKLWTDNPTGVPFTISEAGTENDEAMLVADRVVKDTRSGRRRFGDIAVLYRTNAQSRAMEEAFLTMRIPHVLVGGQRFYDRREIKDMVAYLRVIHNPKDDVSFRRVINVPARSIGSTTLKALEALAVKRGTSLYETAHDQEFLHRLAKKTHYGFKHFIGVIEEGQRIAAEGSVAAILQHVLNRSGYMEELKVENSEESIDRLQNLQEFLNVAHQYDATAEEDEAVVQTLGHDPFEDFDEVTTGDVNGTLLNLFDTAPLTPRNSGPSLSGFLEQVALISDADTLRNNGDAVTLMTLHTAKGLEYPVVFLIGLEEGVFPHSRSLGSDSELEEERRLCYVGMTRAREELHMTYARRRTLFGQPNFNRSSRFLDDISHLDYDSLTPFSRPMGEQEIRTVRPERSGSYTVVEAPKGPLKSPDWVAPFKVGQQVRHGKFGIGVVIACVPLKDDVEVTVAFPGVTGVKKLVQGFAKLEAV